MTSEYPARWFSSRRPLRVATARALPAALESGLVRAIEPEPGARAVLAVLILGVLLVHGLLWRLVHPASADEIDPPHPLPVEVTLARPLPLAQAAPEPRPPQPRTVQPKLVQPHVTRPTVAQAPAPEARPAEPALASSAASASSAEPAAPVAAPHEAPLPETAATGQLGYLNNPPPVYPESALERGLEGVVRLKVFVLASGRPASVELDQSSGSRALDEAALRAVRRWMFVPATRAGQAVDGWASVPVVFKLGK
ncbi:energy transducer TonB [Uliginosibacterium paludis]|uniref:Energy transducer TonB n=1 Tax=Uliginosibacterium paludis TaxID=1615952 RepID=A0ABV2CT91_9RHOO